MINEELVAENAQLREIVLMLHERLKEERISSSNASRMQADVLLNIVAPMMANLRPNFNHNLRKEFNLAYANRMNWVG